MPQLVVPAGTEVLTCGHSSLEHVLTNEAEPEGENTVLLCNACFSQYLKEGEFEVPRKRYVVQEDVYELAPTDWH